MVYLYIGIAGCIGAILRYFISFGLSEQGTIFPYSTLMVNLLGSYLLAFLTTRVFTAFPIPVNYQMAIGTVDWLFHNFFYIKRRDSGLISK